MKIRIKTDHYNMHEPKPILNRTGFTIIELMIATTVFSVILLMAATAMIQIGRIYFKGITSARTQEVARSISDDVSQAIQFSGAKIQLIGTPPGSTAKGFCIDDVRYSYVVDRQLEENPSSDPLKRQSKHVLVVDNPGSGCAAAAQPVDNSGAGINGKELMGIHMRLEQDILPNPATNDGKLFPISVSVIYGDQDVLKGSAPNYSCQATRFGGQFCAISQLSTTVEKRVQ